MTCFSEYGLKLGQSLSPFWYMHTRNPSGGTAVQTPVACKHGSKGTRLHARAKVFHVGATCVGGIVGEHALSFIESGPMERD